MASTLEFMIRLACPQSAERLFKVQVGRQTRALLACMDCFNSPNVLLDINFFSRFYEASLAATKYLVATVGVKVPQNSS